jgi:hypothetical protein
MPQLVWSQQACSRENRGNPIASIMTSLTRYNVEIHGVGTTKEYLHGTTNHIPSLSRVSSVIMERVSLKRSLYRMFSWRVSSYNRVLSVVVVRRPSYVCRARFVTTGAIDLKLCAYVSLGEMTLQTKFRSDLILGLATRGPKSKMQKVL